jgi:hypothetical protein
MIDDHAFPDREQAAERYLLGDMSDAERETYEQHVFSCPECAEDVRTTAVFLDDVRAVAAPVVVAQPRGRVLSFFWPLPAGAAIAATLLLAVAGYQAVQVAGLKRELTAEQRLQSVPSYFLAASRSAGPTITVTADQRKFGLTLSRSLDKPFPFYRCEIRDGAGRVVASEVLKARESGDELEVDVPAPGLTPGAYTVAISGLDSAAAAASPLEPAHYSFTLRREP